VDTKFTIVGQVQATGTYQIGVNDQWYTLTGAGCDTLTNLPPLLFQGIKTYTHNKLRLVGSQVQYFLFSFRPDVSVVFVAKKGGKANVKTCKVYVDGDETYEVYDTNGADCSGYTNTWDIELRQDSGLRAAGESDLPWSRAEKNLPEDAAAGDAAWPRLGPGKSTNTAAMSFSWGVNVGRLLTGREAGQIRLRETNLTANAFSPVDLLYTMTSPNLSELAVVTNIYYTTNYDGANLFVNTNGMLRQIKAPLALADITTNSAWQYSIAFYTTNWITAQSTNDGFCTLATNAQAFVTYFIESPGASPSTNWLRIREVRNGNTNLSDLQFSSASNLWSLRNGTAADYVTISRTITPNAAGSNRVEIVEYKDTGGTSPKTSALS
jgi:hypothetical protein